MRRLPSVHVLAAVDRKCRAGDKARILGAQESDAFRDLRRSPEPPDGNARDDRLQNVGGHRRDHIGVAVSRRDDINGDPRSEEHTSELQSLMRISYDVFCLKKKKSKI